MQEFPTCQAGYFRNLETGRCNKIPEPEVLKPCPDGQYRHPETNRCRKWAAASTLTSCKEGYERNPLTNRCRKIATNTNEPKPCAEGYERNLDTGRCRKVVSGAPAGFAVKTGASGENGLWRWAVGGVLALTGLVIAFQYRMEIAQLFQKFLNRKSSEPEQTCEF